MYFYKELRESVFRNKNKFLKIFKILYVNRKSGFIQFKNLNGLNFFEEEESLKHSNTFEYHFKEDIILFSKIIKIIDNKNLVFFSTKDGFFGYKII